MDWASPEPPTLGEQVNLMWKRGLRLVRRAAVAVALSTAAGIGVGAAVTDNALMQILATLLVTMACLIPFFFLVVRVDHWLARRDRQRGNVTGKAPSAESASNDDVWRRLFAAAPGQAQRLAVLRRSLERSHQALGREELDPDAHELCILIDRRLPDLIHHELEILPPDDRHRRQKVGELIDLVEQFARHCSRRDPADGKDARFQAEVLRRRFEARLTEL